MDGYHLAGDLTDKWVGMVNKFAPFTTSSPIDHIEG